MTIRTAILAADELRAKHDAVCKALLSDRQLLARILKAFVPEFMDSDLEKIENCYIEPDSIRVAETAVEKNQTNIRGRNTEDKSINEGTVYYDILFDAVYPDGEKLIGVMINLEIQNAAYPGYPIEARGIYYASRLFSSQLTEINHVTDYGNLEKVYSLWLIIDEQQSLRDTNTAAIYHITEDSLVGRISRPRRTYDFLSVVVVRISDRRPTDNETIALFSKLFSNKIGKQEKLEYLEKNGIRTGSSTVERINTMCNLSEAIYQEGIEQGKAEGKAEGRAEVLLDACRAGLISEKDAAGLLGITEEAFRALKGR